MIKCCEGRKAYVLTDKYEQKSLCTVVCNQDHTSGYYSTVSTPGINGVSYFVNRHCDSLIHL